MARVKRSWTDDERVQRREQQRELVRKSIEQLRSSEGWRSWLKARARFRSYSTLIWSRSCRRGSAVRFERWRHVIDGVQPFDGCALQSV